METTSNIARRLSDEYNSEQMIGYRWERKIQDAACEGLYRVIVAHVHDNCRNVVKKLVAMGYHVTATSIDRQPAFIIYWGT